MSLDSGEYGYRVEEDGTRVISIPIKAFDVFIGGLYAAGGATMFAAFGNKFIRDAFVASDWWNDFWGKFNDVIFDGAATSVGAVVMSAGIAVMLTDRHPADTTPEYPAPPVYETFTTRVPVYDPTTEVEAAQLALLSEHLTDAEGKL